jgi:hypothetical protein
MSQELLNKIQEIANLALESEDNFAVWKGKINESDSFITKIFVIAHYEGNENDFLIRVKII